MQPRDIEAVHEVTILAFEGLNRRFGQPPDPRPSLDSARIRLEHCLATDPGGAWVAENHRGLVGCSLAIVREGLWGLSLLVVRPDAQSAGVGRELLARAHAHGDDPHGRIVLASPDPRALRAYANLGLALH